MKFIKLSKNVFGKIYCNYNIAINLIILKNGYEIMIFVIPGFNLFFIYQLSLTLSNIFVGNEFLILEKIKNLNETIKIDNNLGKGFQIGHSYFCNFSNSEGDQDWYNFIINHEIGPMLMEYWFDNEETATNQIQNLIS